jgi:hypothetical protein
MIQRNAAIRHDDNDPLWWVITDLLRLLSRLGLLIIVAGLAVFLVLVLT